MTREDSLQDAKLERMTVEKAKNIAKAWEGIDKLFKLCGDNFKDIHKFCEISHHQTEDWEWTEYWFWYIKDKVEFLFITDVDKTEFSDRICIPNGAYYWPLEDGDPCIGDIEMLRNAIKEMSK